MHATEQVDLSYSDKPPVLITGTSETAIRHALRAVEAADYRIADTIVLDQARKRLDRQIAASALWIELDRDGGPAMDELLDWVDRKAAAGQFAAVVSTTGELIDPVAARLCSRATELIVDGDDAGRAAALAIATAHAGMEQRVADVASDQSAARLRQLSDEVSRIAATLARLSSAPAAVPPVMEERPRLDSPEVSAETVRSIIRARRLRSRYFSEDLFADPAWDMLLDLWIARVSGSLVSVSSLCIASAVPPTTALRWIDRLAASGYILRAPDPRDARRRYISLSPRGSGSLMRYFAAVAGTPA